MEEENDRDYGGFQGREIVEEKKMRFLNQHTLFVI